jgi:hypothetical protein
MSRKPKNIRYFVVVELDIPDIELQQLHSGGGLCSLSLRAVELALEPLKYGSDMLYPVRTSHAQTLDRKKRKNKMIIKIYLPR